MSELLSFDASGVQFAWDAHSIKAATTCLQLYDYSILQGWRRKDESANLWFGIHYAAALERFHKAIATGVEREEAILATVHQALIDTWVHDRDEAGNRIPGTGGPATFDHATKNRDSLLRTIIWYFEDYNPDPLRTFIRSDGVPAVENSFRLLVDNGVTFCGHLDRVCLDEAENILIQDQKTTRSTLGPYFFKSYKPDIQMAHYTFSGRAIFHAPIKGVMLDAAQVVVGFSKYDRSPITFTDDELNEYYQETMGTIEATQKATRDQYFPRRTTSCGNYGGCPFRDVCSRPKSVRQNFLEGDFVKHPRWDPLKIRT